MAEIKKAELDRLVRVEGEKLIDLSQLERIEGSTFIGSTEVNGVKRYFEVKVVAKAVTYGEEDLQAWRDERRIIEEGKAERARIAEAKKAKAATKVTKK